MDNKRLILVVMLCTLFLIVLTIEHISANKCWISNDSDEELVIRILFFENKEGLYFVTKKDCLTKQFLFPPHMKNVLCWSHGFAFDPDTAIEVNDTLYSTAHIWVYTRKTKVTMHIYGTPELIKYYNRPDLKVIYKGDGECHLKRL